MEAQIVIHLAGGVAEAIYRGERRESEVLAFAEETCRMDTDMEQARDVGCDLWRVTCRRYDAQPFAEKALALLVTHWSAVEALASALVEEGCIEGARIERIIDRSLSASAAASAGSVPSSTLKPHRSGQ